ncbi:hypothetical protein ASPWEDRAFT_119067 [Aspergillus wentii DTO 134E9]|uniref:C4-dicarboxylate transporter/malic acid transport protein n=1 Tax=Aspergillus wentii DTO 134E9 TaxID=1073089 RepID=A0A1L9R7K4_ASPWE|nr:uncharacterized protein ASPWEDRAFT_119067 [Aspergillus wentii DTO 134E9]OJJ30884.1 hypothetical protein ASPWEDRAFT_119067 [Aspergillus wentii DTO 134E9]
MKEKVWLRQRICQVSWGWYASSMSTGGIALLLHQTPHQFTGLQTIGKIFFIFNLVLFLSICTAMVIRFTSDPSSLKASLQDPNESHFLATAILAIATIIMGIASYGTSSCGPWLNVALRVLFWIYAAVSIFFAVIQNWYLYSVKMASRQPFALVRLLPSFPAMLCGTMASIVVSGEPPVQAIPILFGGTTLQGFGFLMSLFIYAEFVYRLNKSGLPKPSERPEMFIAVGPPSFTSIAIIGMASEATTKFPEQYIISAFDAPRANTAVSTADIAVVLATLTAVFMWTMAFFFFCIAALSTLSACNLHGKGEMGISLAWWSMVFPNTGFILAIIKIGQALESNAILWVSSILTILQVAMWLFVGGAHVWGVYTRRLLWPEEIHES